VQLAALKDEYKEKSEAVSGLLAQVEAVVPGPRRFLRVDDKKEVELLQQRVEALVKEHGELKAENEKLRAEGDKRKGRVTELANKVGGTDPPLQGLVQQAEWCAK
jgi:predicted nuclease with TOPRIM domain